MVTPLARVLELSTASWSEGEVAPAARFCRKSNPVQDVDEGIIIIIVLFGRGEGGRVRRKRSGVNGVAQVGGDVRGVVVLSCPFPSPLIQTGAQLHHLAMFR